MKSPNPSARLLCLAAMLLVLVSACAASGCDVATTLRASTGMRCEGYGKSQVKSVTDYSLI